MLALAFSGSKSAEMRVAITFATVLSVVVSSAAIAQAPVPPVSIQNPSPMVEATRAHERTAKKDSGSRFQFQNSASNPNCCVTILKAGDHPALAVHRRSAEMVRPVDEVALRRYTMSRQMLKCWYPRAQ